MRDFLAERLLAEVMSWSVEEVADNRPTLQTLAAFKYDSYQQFSPGMGFIESLAVWLSHFETPKERQQAYELIRSHLIFISGSELIHLVSITYPDYIRPLLIQNVATKLSIPNHAIAKIINSTEFQIQQRRSLFLGLSDGANIGVFRRSNPQLSNEQIRLSHEIPGKRVEEMLSDLKKDLQNIPDYQAHNSDISFNAIFMLDDFSASGLSYLRKKTDNNSYSGKINKILTGLLTKQGELRTLIDMKDLLLCVILYVATTKAKLHIQQVIQEWMYEHDISTRFEVYVIQEIPNEVCITDKSDAMVLGLLEKYFDESIVDHHYKQGRFEQPYLGFDECGLPLVLYHNTPNNSLPILWSYEHSKFRGLFPRVSRHK